MNQSDSLAGTRLTDWQTDSELCRGLAFTFSGRRTDGLLLRELQRLDIVRVCGGGFGTYLIEMTNPSELKGLVRFVSVSGSHFYGECRLSNNLTAEESFGFSPLNNGTVHVVQVCEVEVLERRKAAGVGF